MATELRVLLIGDAIGRPGRNAISQVVPRYKQSGQAHFVIANGENTAHGKGITRETVKQLLTAGVDVITAGNHTWDNKDIFNIINDETRLLRPANIGKPDITPGRGSGVFEVRGFEGVYVGVFNLLGRTHMAPANCPFHAAKDIIAELLDETCINFLDFHAETTSEKITMGWFLDGQATGVFGTHTHVQTADERVLPQGTAYITDLGMTGGHKGVIGVKYPEVIHRQLTGLPVRHDVADEDVWLCGALVTVDIDTGRAIAIERVRERVL